MLEGIGRNYAYINDPAVGRRKVDMRGVRCGVHRRRAGNGAGRGFAGGRTASRNACALLLRRLRHSTAAVGLLLAPSVALVSAIVPQLYKDFVDDVLIQHKMDWFTPLLIGIAIAALVRAAITAFQQSLLLRLQTKLTIATVSRFLWHVLTLPMEFFTQRHAGDIANRITANEQIARAAVERDGGQRAQSDASVLRGDHDVL